VKPYLLVLFLLLLVTGAFAASAQPAQLVALASRNSKIVQAAGARQRHPGVGRQLLRRKRSDPGRRVESAGGVCLQSHAQRAVHSAAHFSCRHEQQLSQRQSPPGFLAEGSDGNLYGTKLYGGSHNGGVLFRISKTGTALKSCISSAPPPTVRTARTQSG
jgi:uncharacterized repeat protein (TIGR03803 family)